MSLNNNFGAPTGNGSGSVKKKFVPHWSMVDYIALFRMSLRPTLWSPEGKGLLQGMIAFWVAIFLVFDIGGLPLSAFVLWISVDWGEFRRNRRYRESIWYRNTGILPREVAHDLGLYGEYIATTCAEMFLKANAADGDVFNSVVVPKKDGDFNEIDMVVVSPFGLQVVETKARGGTMVGEETGETWTQQFSRNSYEMQNPCLQNQNHINFLLEELWENLPCIHQTPGGTNNLCENVVLFVRPVRLEISPARTGPNSFAQIMRVRDYESYQPGERKLDAAQIGLIREHLRKLSSHSREELDAMFAQRAADQENKKFWHPYVYYAATGRVAGSDKELRLLCRDNGFYKTYYDWNNRVFFALPEFQVLRTGRKYRELLDASGEFCSPDVEAG